MTVKEAISVMTYAEKIQLAWDGASVQITPDDEVMIGAFGDYVVKYIMSPGEPESYEIGVLTRPVKVGETA